MILIDVLIFVTSALVFYDNASNKVMGTGWYVLLGLAGIHMVLPSLLFISVKPSDWRASLFLGKQEIDKSSKGRKERLAA